MVLGALDFADAGCFPLGVDGAAGVAEGIAVLGVVL